MGEEKKNKDEKKKDSEKKMSCKDKCEVKIVLLFLATFCPFLTVILCGHYCDDTMYFSLLLCLLGFVPGVIHAYWIVLTTKI